MLFQSFKAGAGKPPMRRVLIGAMGLAYGLLLGAGIMTLAVPEAQALRVTMKRVVFEGPKRADMIVLINNTSDEMAYRFGWRRMRMTEDKSLVPVEDGDAAADIKSASDMIQFAPRRVVLPPGGSQQVRLMLRRPRDLAEGEYRAHFWIEPEAESVKFDPNPEAAAASGPAVQIKMLTGITLPVIVRAGNVSATAGLTDVRAQRVAGGQGKVNLTITRDGNRSLYGDFDFTCGATVVHQVRGVAVYTEVTRRRMEFNLRELPADCGTLGVVYKAAADDLQFSGGVMAQASVAVQ